MATRNHFLYIQLQFRCERTGATGYHGLIGSLFLITQNGVPMSGDTRQHVQLTHATLSIVAIRRYVHTGVAEYVEDGFPLGYKDLPFRTSEDNCEAAKGSGAPASDHVMKIVPLTYSEANAFVSSGYPILMSSLD
jgi:hypothetical protein|tara:strand:+ start:1351 stop:1755 length:405 start_codon:yes stop_codon:yes gene_type:complete